MPLSSCCRRSPGPRSCHPQRSLGNEGRRRRSHQGREPPGPDCSPRDPKSSSVGSGFMGLKLRRRILTSSDSIHFKFYFFFIPHFILWFRNTRSGRLYEGLNTRTLQPQMSPGVAGPKHCWSSEDLTTRAQSGRTTRASRCPGIRHPILRRPEPGQSDSQVTRHSPLVPHHPTSSPSSISQSLFHKTHFYVMLIQMT